MSLKQKFKEAAGFLMVRRELHGPAVSARMDPHPELSGGSPPAAAPLFFCTPAARPCIPLSSPSLPKCPSRAHSWCSSQLAGLLGPAANRGRRIKKWRLGADYAIAWPARSIFGPERSCVKKAALHAAAREQCLNQAPHHMQHPIHPFLLSNPHCCFVLTLEGHTTSARIFLLFDRNLPQKASGGRNF